MIATTSSAQKGVTLKKLGADHVINYREDPDWGVTAKKLTTDGAGADHVIEVGGEHTMGQSLKAVKYGGIITLIGFLGGAKPKNNILEALSNICTLRGIFVGSKEQMEDMCRAIEANDIHPVVDQKIFPLDQAREAYEYMVGDSSLPCSVLRVQVLTACRVVGEEALRKAVHQHPVGCCDVLYGQCWMKKQHRAAVNWKLNELRMRFF